MELTGGKKGKYFVIDAEETLDSESYTRNDALQSPGGAPGVTSPTAATTNTAPTAPGWPNATGRSHSPTSRPAE